MGLLDAQEPTPLQNEPPRAPAQGCSGCTLTMTVPATLRRVTPTSTPLPTTRTRVGIGEAVDLSCSVDVTSWSVSPTKAGSLRGNVNGDAKAGRFVAADVPGPVTVTATAGGCSCEVKFTIVAPSSFWMSILTPNGPPAAIGNGLMHTHGRPDIGFKTAMAIDPSDVSFDRLRVRELNDAVTSADAYFSEFNGKGHRDVEQGKTAGPSGEIQVNPASVQLGSVCNLLDGNYSGLSSKPLPATTATWRAPSRFEYRLIADPFTGAPGPWTAFPKQQEQVVTVAPNGTTTMTKATASGSAALAAKDSTWHPP